MPGLRLKLRWQLLARAGVYMPRLRFTRIAWRILIPQEISIQLSSGVEATVTATTTLYGDGSSSSGFDNAGYAWHYEGWATSGGIPVGYQMMVTPAQLYPPLDSQAAEYPPPWAMDMNFYALRVADWGGPNQSYFTNHRQLSGGPPDSAANWIERPNGADPGIVSGLTVRRFRVTKWSELP